jgi:hypothetical protein
MQTLQGCLYSPECMALKATNNQQWGIWYPLALRGRHGPTCPPEANKQHVIPARACICNTMLTNDSRSLKLDCTRSSKVLAACSKAAPR